MIDRFLMATLRGMLRALIWLGQFLLVGSALYSSGIALWGLRTPASAGSDSRRRMRVVVAAHNEELVIAGIASDLAAQDHPEDLIRCCVVADRCKDSTAEVAATFVAVEERSDGEGAKGAAISWYLSHHPLEEDESLLILDADNRIAVEFVGAVASELDRGSEVVQAYLDVSNPDGSVLATANALTYWASNRMVQLARSNLGWSCDLGGTGMAMTKQALDAAGGFTDDLTDDLALNVRLNLAGYRARWMHDVRLSDEKPLDMRSTVTQRARWVRGKRDVQRNYGWALIRNAFLKRQPALLDLAFRLFNPGRSFIALSIAVLAAVSFLAPGLGLWIWWALAGVAAVVVLLPMAFLAVEGIPGRYIVRYPYVTLLAILWLPIRVASRIMKTWTRTGHGENAS